MSFLKWLEDWSKEDPPPVGVQIPPAPPPDAIHKLLDLQTYRVQELTSVVEAVIADLQRIALLEDSTPEEARELTDWAEELISELVRIHTMKGAK